MSSKLWWKERAALLTLLSRGNLLPFCQAERPLGDLAKYRVLLELLKDALLRVGEARETFIFALFLFVFTLVLWQMRKAVPNLDASVETKVSQYRTTIGPAVRALLQV